MSNPFEEIMVELGEIKAMLITMQSAKTINPVEIIDRKELMRRLDVSEPTIISSVRKGAIPEIRVKNTARYDWYAVIESLKNN